MSPRNPPGWRRAFDRAERLIGPSLESVANAPEFFSLLASARRVQRTVRSRTDELTSWALHQAGLPSGRDIRGLERQIGTLQQEIGALRRELAERDLPEEQEP